MAAAMRKHSGLYIRNSILAGACVALTFGALYFTPWTARTLPWLAILVLVNYAVWGTYVGTHPHLRALPRLSPSDFGMRFEEASFTTRDGFRVAAWFIPGTNRAALLLVHGMGGGKVSMLEHARVLSAAGYSLLLPDLRAHGQSDGDTIDGLHEANGLLAAVDYLRTRQEVDPERIGAVGISLGALTVLQAARQSTALKALVLEGMGPVCLADHGGRPKTLRRWLNYPINWITYTLGDFFANVHQEEGVMAALQRIAGRPVMLISAGRGKEIYFNRLFHAAASEPKSHWELPHAFHAMALIYEKKAYVEKVTGFFNRHLAGV